jgi:hypothetical protein
MNKNKHSCKPKRNKNSCKSKKNKYTKKYIKGGNKLCRNVGVGVLKTIPKSTRDRLTNALNIDPTKQILLVPKLDGFDYKIERRTPNPTIMWKLPINNSYNPVEDVSDNTPCENGQTQFGGLKLVTLLRRQSQNNNQPSSVPVSPVSAPVSPVSAPVSPVSAPVSPVSAPVSPVSAPVSPVSVPAPVNADDDLELDATDQPIAKALAQANARETQDAMDAENNAKLALKNAKTAGHVPYIEPADFFQQIQEIQELFNMGKTTSPELKFLGNIIKYRAFAALNQTSTKMNNSLYKLSINPMPPSPNASPQEYQNYLHEKANFPVSVLLRCDMENGKMQIRGVYAISSSTQLTKDAKSTTTCTLSKLAKIQSKSDYDQQNAVIIQQNAEHIANLRKLTAYAKYDAPQDIMRKYLSPTALEQGIVPEIKATETDIIFTPDPATPAVFSNLTNYIKENNTTSYSVTRLHIYNYEASSLKTFVKRFTTTVKGGKKHRKIRGKQFTNKHKRHIRNDSGRSNTPACAF